MGLSKEIILTVKDYEVKLNRDIKFYENDTIDLCFSILEYGIEVKDGVAVNKLMPINALKSYMLIETPQGVDYAESTKVENNRVIFNLGNKYSQFIGIGRMQIVIKDNDGCRITLPEFPFEIRESINSNWDKDIAKDKADECYKSWKAHAEHGNSYLLLKKMDKYYNELWRTAYESNQAGEGHP